MDLSATAEVEQQLPAQDTHPRAVFGRVSLHYLGLEHSSPEHSEMIRRVLEMLVVVTYI